MKEKRVGELIRQGKGRPGWVNSGSTLKEAVSRLERRLSKGDATPLMVIRRKGQQREVLGMVTLDAILSKLEPSNFSHKDELPIFWQGQLTEQARDLFSKEVDVVMVELQSALNENSTLMEALHIMNTLKTRVLVVVNEDRVVGLLTRQHLYKYIAGLAGK